MIYAKKALKAGDYRAYSVLTLVEIYVNQNFKVAFEYAKKGEKYLLRWCIFELGKFYYFGNPCEVDHKKAIHCFQDAGHYGATKGYLYQAMVQLESKDKSLIKPYAAYVALERYVENGGVKNAQYYYLLGNYYISKPGKEYFKAKECFNEVAKSDDATAGMLNNIGVFYKLEMNDLKKAAEFYKMAMDKGSQSAAISYRNIVGK